MSCHRCHGLMYPEDLLIGASGSGRDRVCGWRCVSCGDVVEQVIVQNRMRARGRRFVRREKRPRQPVRMTLDFSWPACGAFSENRAKDRGGGRHG